MLQNSSLTMAEEGNSMLLLFMGISEDEVSVRISQKHIAFMHWQLNSHSSFLLLIFLFLSVLVNFYLIKN